MKITGMAIVCLCMLLSSGEPEGFTFLGSDTKGVAVSSFRKNDVNMMKIDW